MGVGFGAVAGDWALVVGVLFYGGLRELKYVQIRSCGVRGFRGVRLVESQLFEDDAE